MRLKNNSLPKAFIFCLLSVSLFACKKKEADDPVVTCTAGTGGSTTLIVELRHHNVLIPNDSLQPDTVWIKFNATNAGSGYDLQKIGIPGEPNVIINNLKCGNYFLTASGYDNSISLDVTGGLGINIAENKDTVLATIAVVE